MSLENNTGQFDDSQTRIGWVSVVPTRSKDYFAFDVTLVSCVSEGKPVTRFDEGEKFKIDNEYKTKLVWAGLSMRFHPNIQFGEYSELGYGTHDGPIVHDDSRLYSLSFYDRNFLDFESVRDKRVWALGSAGLLATLKDQMSNANLAEFYPNFYYKWNTSVANRSERDRLRYRTLEYTVPLWTSLLIDLSMQNSTRLEVNKAKQIVDLLARREVQAREAIANLTDHSPLPAKAEQFLLDRKSAHQDEAQLKELADTCLSQKQILLACGNIDLDDSNGAYMNASSRTKGNYEREVEGIKRDGIELPLRDLYYERADQSIRHEYAQHGHAALRTLLIAEQARA